MRLVKPEAYAARKIAKAEVKKKKKSSKRLHKKSNSKVMNKIQIGIVGSEGHGRSTLAKAIEMRRPTWLATSGNNHGHRSGWGDPCGLRH